MSNALVMRTDGLSGDRAFEPGSPPPSLLTGSRNVIVAIGLFTALCNLLMLVVPLYTIQLFDRVLSSGSIDTLVMLTLIAIGGLIFFGIFELLRTRLLVRLGANLELDFSELMLRRELSGNRSEADGQPVMDLRELSQYLASPNFVGLLDAPWCPVFVAIIYIINPTIGIIALISAAVLLLLGILTERLTAPLLAKARQTHTFQSAIVLQFRRGAELARAMGLAPKLADRWQRIVRRSLVTSLNSGDRVGAMSAITRFLRLLIQLTVMGVGVSLILKQEMTPGVLIACSLLLSRALAPVEQTISGLRAFSGAREAYRRLVAELVATERETNRMPLAEPRGAITLDGAGLRLPDRKAPIIDDVSIDIKPGEIVAIIGPSGSGKSTLLRMMAGLQQTTSGSVRIDGTRIADWPSQQLAERTGYLPQDVELFTGSVAENIAGMEPEPDPALVLEASRRAHVEPLVQQLPEGFNTIVGPHGTGLSGGQRQRLGLARAVYGTRRILLLDEPDAHLDDEGQQNLIRTVLAQKKLGTTVVLTSHRKTMLAAADKVLLMIEGRCVQYGPPATVLRGIATRPLRAGQSS